MHRLTLPLGALVLAGALLPAPAHAQFGRLRDRARQAVENATRRDDPPTPAGAAAGAAVGAAPAAAAAAGSATGATDDAGRPLRTGATLALDPAHPPTLAFFSFLNAWSGPDLFRRGNLTFSESYHAIFLPAPPNTHYTEFDGPALAVRVRRADGAAVATQRISAGHRDGPFYEVQGGPPVAERLAAGDYVMEWLLEGEPFYQFPFAVRAVSSGDAYAPETHYLLDGPWDDYVAVRWPNEARYNLEVGIWNRTETYERDRASEYVWQFDLKKDGRTIGVYPSLTARAARARGDVTGGISDLEPWWEYHSQELVTPDETGARSLTPADLTDGTYTLEYALYPLRPEARADHGTNDMLGTPVRTSTMRFEVRGGRMVPQGRQADGADPLTRIDGGAANRNAVYYFLELQ